MVNWYSNLRYYWHLAFQQDLEQTVKDSRNRLASLFELSKNWYGAYPLGTALDLGCGRFCIYSRILRASGFDVIAVDQEYVYEIYTLEIFPHVFHNQFRSILRDYLADLQERREKIQKLIEEKPSKRISIVQNDIRDMKDVKDSSVDLCISVDVLEHVTRLKDALKEIKRVLKPNGVTIHEIGLWSSLQGDHDPDWLTNPVPWKHLRGKPYFELPYGTLNRLYSTDYIKLFLEQFKEVNYTWTNYRNDIPTEKMLTKEVEDEIWKYNFHIPRNDLLYTSFVIAARN